jgi:hypothetical protein
VHYQRHAHFRRHLHQHTQQHRQHGFNSYRQAAMHSNRYRPSFHFGVAIPTSGR